MKYRLSDCVDIISGGTPKKSISRYWNGKIPWITIKNFTSKYPKTVDGYITQEGLENSAAKLSEEKDILISARGTVGEVMMVHSGYTFNQSIYGLRVRKKFAVPEYVYYWLMANKQTFTKNVHGSVFDTITRKTFDHIQIDLPCISDQLMVVNKLNNIDDKITVNEAINDNLNSLLDCIFNNFYPHENNEISSKLKTIAEIGSSNRIFAKEYRDVGIPFLRGKEISLLSQGTTPKDTLFISSERYRELKNIPNSKDILITSVGTIGNVYQVEKFRLPFYYKDGNIIRVTPKKGFEDYIYLWLNSKFGDEAIKAVTIGSTQKALTISSIKKFELYVPNNYELQNFNNLVDPLINQIQENHKENECLQEVKSILLNKYF